MLGDDILTLSKFSKDPPGAQIKLPASNNPLHDFSHLSSLNP